jgi:hypothetical protein
LKIENEKRLKENQNGEPNSILERIEAIKNRPDMQVLQESYKHIHINSESLAEKMKCANLSDWK